MTNWSKCYPEYHSFLYTAVVDWPRLEPDQQRDWIDSIILIESWLETSIGPHYLAWAWVSSTRAYSCAVAFRWERDKTLFLLRWH